MSGFATNPDGIPVDRRSKRQRLAQIERNPSIWQVCEGCESVVSTQANVCPRCHAYRFDGDKARVIRIARRIVRQKEDELPLSD